MSDTEKELEETRAALAPTLEATAAILPWVAKARQPRFPPEKARRWQEAGESLAALWSARHQESIAPLRPVVFELYGAALELADPDCLRLAEALASATDRLEATGEISDPRLVAALSATCEGLTVPDCLEQETFADRARHFAERLERCADPLHAAQVRSPVLDRLFAAEAGECLERIHEALGLLPPDAYGVRTAADDIARLAEPLDLDDIVALAHRLVRLILKDGGLDLDAEDSRAAVLTLVADLEQTIKQLITQE